MLFVYKMTMEDKQITEKDLNLILQHLKRFVREKDQIIKEVTTQKEKDYWSGFFQLSELKKVINKLEKINA